MTGWLFDQLLGQIVEFLLTFAAQTLDELWGLLTRTLLHTPDVTTLPQVQTISARSLMIVNTSFVLAIIAAGITVMTRETLQVRYGIAELAPRLVIGFVAANFATPLCRGIIEVANALTLALTGEGISSAGSVAQLRRVITGAMLNPANQLLVAIIGLFLAALTAMLLVAWIIRLIVLIVLVGIAPAALACHALPFTDPAARLWWRAMIGCVAVVLAQALALHTTLTIFLDPAANRAALGVPTDSGGVFDLFVVACLLWLTVRIPALIRRYVTTGGGRQNIAGYVFRLVVVQQLTRGLLGRVPRLGAGAGGSASRGASGPPAGQTVIPYWRPRLPQPTPARPRPGRSRPAVPGPGQRSHQPVLTGWQDPPPARPAYHQPPLTGWQEPAPAPAGPGRPRPVPPGVNPATVRPRRRGGGAGAAPAPAGPRYQQPPLTGWQDPPPARPTHHQPPLTGWREPAPAPPGPDKAARQLAAHRQQLAARQAARTRRSPTNGQGGTRGR